MTVLTSGPLEIHPERTERGDAPFLDMTRGACAPALDHQTLDLWQD
jgi:hypothetical protein